MAAPATAEELLSVVRQAQLTDEVRLDAYLRRLDELNLRPTDAKTMVRRLVADGFLTYFQAEQVLLGKHRGFVLGKYKILERLGHGGMGQVFLGEHLYMRRRVAIKVLPLTQAEDPVALEQFYREARATAVLDHPNLVRSHDIDQEGPVHFLVMEFVDGVSLRKLVRRHGPLEIDRACEYIRQAAAGLQHAHEAGLVHRDIKPGNLMVDRDGVVKIFDLGLARFHRDAQESADHKSIVGTADYVAPEQVVNSSKVDIRADIYALGCTFYYLLTGQAPFPDGSDAEKMQWQQTRQPTPISKIRPIPVELAAIIEKMMAKQPGDRFTAPAAVVVALEPFCTSFVPPPKPSELPRLSVAAQLSLGSNRWPAVRVERRQAVADGNSLSQFELPRSDDDRKSSFFQRSGSGSIERPSSHRADTRPRASAKDDTVVAKSRFRIGGQTFITAHRLISIAIASAIGTIIGFYVWTWLMR